MSFAQAHDFTIENLYAVDGNGAGGKGVFQLRTLAQAACLGAGHQSEERYDAPKCHPETRKAVMNDIMSWVDSNDSKEPMMWMSGPAGAGKSSIAQTICERCHEEGKLLASFFFSRSAVGTGRDDGNRLVPTIAIQLSIALGATKPFIINTMESNPAILSYSMEVQMQKLVLDPLENVPPLKLNKNDQSRQHVPYLVVIDGLDECKNPHMQARIITLFSAIFSRSSPNIRVLFASRPELEIRTSFNSSAVSDRCAKIVLNEGYNPDSDIEVYLQSEFSSLMRGHHLKSLRSQESKWPSSHDINWLVRKSSGQFIYASTIMKYLKHPRRDPRTILASIISATSTEDIQMKLNESPYSELDSLYRHILRAAVINFQGATNSIINVFQVLLFAFQRSHDIRHPSTLATFLSMEQDELEILLSDLHSIIFIPESDQDDGFYHRKSGKSLLDNRPPRYFAPSVAAIAESPIRSQNMATTGIRFYHASFGDFLKGVSRSKEFYIDETKAHMAIAGQCFARIMEYKSPSEPNPAEHYSRSYYFSHIKNSGYNGDLLREIGSSDLAMRNLLELLMQLNNSNVEEVDHVNKQLECIFKFDFKNHDSRFALPLNDEVQKICSAMNRIGDELILSAYPSVDLTERQVVVAIIEKISRKTPEFHYSKTRTTSIFLCWLAMLLEIPQRGKHLYLDSDKSLRLYSRICSDFEFREFCVCEWKSQIAQYLLDRIEPSADLDVDQFLAMSNKLINEITNTLPDYFPFVEKKTLDMFDKTWRNNKIIAEKCLKVYIQKSLELKNRNTSRTRNRNVRVGRWFGELMNTFAKKKFKGV